MTAVLGTDAVLLLLDKRGTSHAERADTGEILCGTTRPMIGCFALLDPAGWLDRPTADLCPTCTATLTERTTAP